jgi:hypothetical protein
MKPEDASVIASFPGPRFGRLAFCAGVIVLSMVLVAGLNRGSLAPQIVGMDTADGCATIFVRDLYSAASPADGYRKVNAEDESCGRFRPLGHYYMAASYGLNALRCGLPFVMGCQSPMSELANAELSGHTRYQLVFAGMVVAVAAWLVLAQSGSWAAVVSVILFGASALSLGGNLYKYYADGQEILLALMALAYLFLFLKGLSAVEQRKPYGWSLTGGCCFGVLMTASKETAIVIAAMVMAFCGVSLARHWWSRGRRFKFDGRDGYLTAHLALLAGAQTWLLVNIPSMSGRYTEKYSLQGGPDVWARLRTLVSLVADNPGACAYLIVVASLCGLAGVLLWVRPGGVDRQSRAAFRLAVLSGGAGIGSVLVYLPWQLVARKYLYCAEILLVVCTCSLIGAFVSILRSTGVHRIVVTAVGMGLVIVPLCNVRAAAIRNDRYYAKFYGSRQLLAAACRELQAEVLRRPAGGTAARVAIFNGLRSLGHEHLGGQEQLHLERFLNQACGLNVLSQGQLLCASRSDYSSRVLVPHPYAPMVELHLMREWQEADWTDVLLIDAGDARGIDFAAIRRLIESSGLYELVVRRSVGYSAPDECVGEVALYRRRVVIAGAP